MKKKKGLKKRNSSKRSRLGVKAINDRVKFRKKEEDSVKKEKSKGMQSSQKMQVDICNVCGDNGFINALMHCSVCSDIVVHQYCLGIPPGSIDDTFDWICEYCSPSLESGHQKFTMEESVREPASASKTKTEQYKNAIVSVEEELEPLCILPPLSQSRNSEYHHQSAEVVPNSASTHQSDTFNFNEEHEPGFSSFVHRSMSSCDGLHLHIDEGVCGSTLISSDHPVNEFEAPVSSFMESPKEIMRGLVLLVTPSGDIIIHIGPYTCQATSTVSMTNSCNKRNSEKLVNDLGLLQKKSCLVSHSNVDKSRKVAYECVDQEAVECGDCSHGTDKEIVAGQSNEDIGFPHFAAVTFPEKTIENADGCKGIIMGHPGSLDQSKRKRTAVLMKFDLIEPECKRVSKRSEIVPSLNNEVGACEVMVSDIPSIGNERNDQPINATEVDILSKIHHGTRQTDTFINDPLTRNNLHTELNNRSSALSTCVVDTCGNNVKERAAQVVDRLCDQEMARIGNLELGLDSQRLSFDNVITNHTLSVACDPENEKGFSRGIGSREEALPSTSLASSPRLVQDCSYMNQFQGAHANMTKSPCKGCKEKFEQTMDFEKYVKYKPDENEIQYKETFCSMDLDSIIQNEKKNKKEGAENETTSTSGPPISYQKPMVFGRQVIQVRRLLSYNFIRSSIGMGLK